MKMRLFLMAVTILGFQLTGWAAEETSKISGFAGKYSGTFVLNSSGSSYTGPATGRFRASSSKEKGTLLLTSQIPAGPSSVVFSEQFRFNKRSLVYTFSQVTSGSSATGSGAGRAAISKRTIRFFTTFSITGTTFTVTGTIHRTKRGLTALNTLSNGSGAATFAYSLRQRK